MNTIACPDLAKQFGIIKANDTKVMFRVLLAIEFNANKLEESVRDASPNERKQKMRKVLIFVFAMCLSLFAVSAMAQTSTTGSIEGTVTDPQGRAVPNATVTATSPNLISAQSAQTDDQGRYKLLNLPPGRYTVTVGATSGFAEATRSDVEVNLSRTTSADVSVPIAGQKVEVTITSTAGAAIDVTNNTSG